MQKGKVYQSTYPDNAPEWYWTRGLHDACIIGAESFEYPFGYDKYRDEKDQYNRNVFTLKINAEDAMFDSKVKEIRFFNYKILSNHIRLQNRKKVWWLADRLSEENSYSYYNYMLEIDLQDFASSPTEFTFKIKFGWAEVDRI